MLGPQGVVPAGGTGAPTELTLVRHGRTGWHSDNRYAGASDVPLDEVGLTQADRLAGWAARHPHDVLACSPLRRARQTAAPVAAALGVRAEVVPTLREMDFGVAEGATLAELRQRDPAAAEAFLADPLRYPFPGAEPPETVAERVLGGLRELVARHPGASVLVVGHNTALRLALCGWLGIPLRHYRDVLPRLDNTAITRLRVPADLARPPALLCLNVSLDSAAADSVPADSVAADSVPVDRVPADAPPGVTALSTTLPAAPEETRPPIELNRRTR